MMMFMNLLLSSVVSRLPSELNTKKLKECFSLDINSIDGDFSSKNNRFLWKFLKRSENRK